MSVDLISRKTITTKLLSEKTVFKMLTDKLLSSVAVIISLARTLVKNEANALSIDFTDSFFSSTGQYGSAYVKDTGTPANDYDSTPYGLLTYTSPSLKMTRGPDGLLRFGAHNMLQRSDSYTNAYWIKERVTETDTSLTETADTGLHRIVRNAGLTGITGATYALAGKFKANGRDYVSMRIWDGGYAGASFNLATGAVATVEAGITATIASAGSGYYLCTIEKAASGSSLEAHVEISADGTVAQSYAGDITKGILLNSLHLRRTPSDSTYLATTSAARYALPYEWDASGNLQGILVEEARTNRFLNCLDPGSASFVGDGFTYPTTISSPIDGLSAKVCSTGTGTSRRYALQSTLGAGSQATSFIFKHISGDEYYIAVLTAWTTDTDPQYVVFNPRTLAVETSVGGASGSVENLGNGWYKLTVTGTPVANTWRGIEVCNSAFSFVWTPTVDQRFAWGAIQNEAGSFSTSLIPTLGSTVTRAADNITLATSAFPFNSTGPITAYAQLIRSAIVDPTYPRALGFFNEGLLLGDVNSQNLTTKASFYEGGTFATATAGSGTSVTGFKIAAAVSAGGSRSIVVNNGSVATASGAIGLSSPLVMGSDRGVASFMNGHISKIMVLPRAMSNADLQTLTLTGQLP